MKDRASDLAALFTQYCVLPLLVVGALVLLRGYRFPTENASVDVPPILARLQPQLFRHDFMVQQFLEFNPRTFNDKLVSALARTDLGLAGARFVLYLAALASFLFGMRAIGRRLGLHPFSTGFLTFVALNIYVGTLGGAVSLVGTNGRPAILAMGVAIWGIYFATARCWIRAYACFGVASLLQFLIGLLPGLLLLPSLVSELRRHRSPVRTLLAMGCWGLGMGLVYLPMVALGQVGSEVLSDAQFVHVYATLRAPHHLVPTAWPIKEWTGFLLFHAGSLVYLLRARSGPRAIRLGIFTVLAVTAVCLLLNYLFVECMPVALVARLQFARMSPFARLAVFVGLALSFDCQLRRGNGLFCALLLLTLVSPQPGVGLIGLTVVSGLLERMNTFLSPRGSAAVGMALVVLWTCLCHPFVRAGSTVAVLGLLICFCYLNRWMSSHPLRRCSLVALPLAVLIVLGLHLHGDLRSRWGQTVERDVTRRVRVWDPHVTRLARGFRRISHPDALVILPPSWRFHHFRLLSRRSVFVDFKGAPFTDHGLKEWIGRIELLTGGALQPETDVERAYQMRQTAGLVRIARQYGATHIVTGTGWHTIPGRVVLEQGPWVIFELTCRASDPMMP